MQKLRFGGNTIKAIILLFLFIGTIEAKQTYGSVIVDAVVSIYDGDTFRVNINSYPPIIGKNMSIRLNGVDTPEMRGKCQTEKLLARKAKQLTVSKLRSAKVVELRNIQKGKYFRIVADVYLDNISLATVLIENNLAVYYDGGKKIKDWCE
ncbi:hypothetical protein ALC152_01470 [Arcobacter sp. 15-2]|uniref:thermonuclease family protein n=1 Tax=Arcobacter sp. 15-2 TaxID=3374109 RepID=UPI00399D0FD0